MLSFSLRASRPISARSIRHFSASPAPRANVVDNAAALQVTAPADYRPSALSGASSSSNSQPSLIGSASANIQEIDPTSAVFIPPSAAQLSSDHGLYGFFRRKADPNQPFETFTDPTIKYSGRPWLASELRLKSFKDLHTLWYVLLRERNMLATQREEMRRMGLHKDKFPHSNAVNTAKCRKSMARIKAIMNERRVAYSGALQIAEKEREAAEDAKILKFGIDQLTTQKHKQHAEQLRAGVVPRRMRTQRAGVRVRERRPELVVATKQVVNRTKAKAGEVVEMPKTKKARWTKAQKLANEAHKKRQAEGKARNPANIHRRLHVV
ncbi:54S ribosomal protein l4 [Favolaschia claudopus]|uniref:Large ribosomal subunit protein uL29m n=1 Tax=Favolaschia claudopus TaxID=2862362 RepID=A0AAW0D5P3_9AGAR